MSTLRELCLNFVMENAPQEFLAINSDVDLGPVTAAWRERAEAKRAAFQAVYDELTRATFCIYAQTIHGYPEEHWLHRRVKKYPHWSYSESPVPTARTITAARRERAEAKRAAFQAVLVELNRATFRIFMQTTHGYPSEHWLQGSVTNHPWRYSETCRIAPIRRVADVP